MKRAQVAFLIAVVFSVTSTLGSAFQENDSLTDKWVFKQPTSPLRVTISSNGEDYALNNYSTRRVIGYRLGCAAEKAGGAKIKRKGKLKRVEIAPLDESANQRFAKTYTIYADQDFYPCVQKKLKLIVLEVRFSDGSKWKL